MEILSDGALPTLQREVHGLLGRCMLRLQQYERLMKAIVAHHEISGPPQALETVRAARIAQTNRKTLGTLVGDLFDSYVAPEGNGTPAELTSKCAEDVTSFGMRIHLALSDADFARTRNELKELVALRNDLVHHFIEQHDLGSLDGCRGAQAALIAACSRIDQHVEQIRGWAADMEQCRRLIAEFVQSDKFRDFVVNGIAPDGTVHWHAAGIVCRLQEAAGGLAVDGWASVYEAGRWISDRYPDQLPARYGCRSWRQVVHESGVFELRYFETGGQRTARYREKEHSATLH